MRPRFTITTHDDGTSVTLKYAGNVLFKINKSTGQVAMRAGVDSDSVIT